MHRFDSISCWRGQLEFGGQPLNHLGQVLTFFPMDTVYFNVFSSRCTAPQMSPTSRSPTSFLVFSCLDL